MEAKTPMNNWLLTKILTHLSVREGFTIEETSDIMKGMRAKVKDAFGYIYEIDVSTLTRTQDDERDGTHELAKKFFDSALTVPSDFVLKSK